MAVRLSKAIRLGAYCSVVVMALLLSGCIRNDGRDCQGGIIEINPTIAGGRITGNSFDPGDQIGLYVSVSPGIPDPDNYAYNIAYTFDGTRWTAPGGSLLPWPEGKTLDLYAYWPYDASLSTGDTRAYPFTVGVDQTSYEKYILNDFLWARAGRQLPGEPVPLLFSHSLSRVQINIVSSFDAGDDWPQGAEAAILGLSRETTIDLTDGVAAWEGAYTSGNGIEKVFKGLAAIGDAPIPREIGDILPLALNTPAAGYDLSLAAIITPQRFTGGNPLIRIILDEVEYVFVPSADFSFRPGVSLTVNLTLVEQPPGLVVDLDDIDWSRSRVWNVYDGSTVVAQVCREYLQGPSAPDVQAVVVYPVTGGIPDFSAGYAARVYLGNKNNAGGYDIDPGNVHGGSVDFSAATLYIPGVLPPVRKVAIDETSGITGTYDAAPANLTIQPATVSDYDGNSYPVVKINQWYWTASNLKTTRYMSGNSFTAWPYGGNTSNTDTYGLLYSGYTASEPQNLLPSPWHVPLASESNAMHAYLQPHNGSKMKANTLWQSLDNSNDVSGFSMLPGGVRNGSGVYSQIGTTAWWWTDTPSDFELTYYTIGAQDETVSSGAITYGYAMSLRLVLTDPTAL